MARMSALHSPSPCLAIVKQRRLETWGVKGNTCLVLDGISDPGNFGTLIRTAEWFGVHSIFCTADTVDCYNPKSIQSSMGSIFRQDIYYGEPDQLVEFLSRKNFSLLAAMLEGESVFDYPWPTSAALVIGSESHGIRPNWQSSIQHKLTIPGAAGAESLNAAIAGSILMAERFRTIH
jgi:TrmH family RNA methyltransferase